MEAKNILRAKIFEELDEELRQECGFVSCN